MVMNETELIAEVRKGYREAFAEIVRLHHVPVRAYLSKYIQLDDVVDDAAQETFLAAYKAIATYRGDAPFRTWLLGIARHRALRYLEELQQRRSRESVALDAALDERLIEKLRRDSADIANHSEKLDALHGCVKSLPETSARIVAEFYFEGRTAAEVARRTG